MAKVFDEKQVSHLDPEKYDIREIIEDATWYSYKDGCRYWGEQDFDEVCRRHEVVRNYHGNVIPMIVFYEHTDEEDYHGLEYETDQELFDAYCKRYEERTGESFWLDEPNPQF